MPRPAGERGPTDTGVLLDKKLPVPKMGRESEPRMRRGGGMDGKFVTLLGLTLVAGAMIGFLVRPTLKADSRIGVLEDRLAETQKLADGEKSRADAKAQELEKTADARKTAEQKLVEAQKAQSALANQAKDAEAKAKEAAAVQAKLKVAVDKNAGAVVTDDDEIRIQLVDKVLFKPQDDQLTDGGKRVLERIAVALKEVPDKQIAVHGHTDDQPVPTPKAPPPPPPPKKGKPAPPPPPSAGPKFATNWELSAARALAVVHYLQDHAKVDPTRLAVSAFGQYRPMSKNRALNRRLEIVLTSRPKK